MKQFDNHELIAAIATPQGNGGVGIVRVSGKDDEVLALANRLLHTKLKPRYAHYLPFYDQKKQVIDQGIALYFPAPHSFTGESVLELQAHGGAVILDCLLSEVLRLGARMANPGEFSLRAFTHGKIDLLQAEAVCDLISAGTEAAARSASRSLQGEFSTRVHALLQRLVDLRRYVEAAIDFSEEEIDFLAEGQVREQLHDIGQAVADLLANAQQGVLLQKGATLAIVGEPNVGKSSLLNRLTATDTAIVTDIAGTTRDVLREKIQIGGLPIHLVDTAGLRETQDVIEQAGIERSWQEVEKADCILFVWDLSTGYNPLSGNILPLILQRIGQKVPVIAVGNKLDQAVGKSVGNLGRGMKDVRLSAKTGHGIDELRTEIQVLVGFSPTLESSFIARRRHVAALQSMQKTTEAAIERAEQGLGDCLAEELRYAQNSLAELTGEMTADDLLGEIFTNFCVGK